MAGGIDGFGEFEGEVGRAFLRELWLDWRERKGR